MWINGKIIFLTMSRLARGWHHGSECGVHASRAMLVKYLHGHEFSICQLLLPWGEYHL